MHVQYAMPFLPFKETRVQQLVGYRTKIKAHWAYAPQGVHGPDYVCRSSVIDCTQGHVLSLFSFDSLTVTVTATMVGHSTGNVSILATSRSNGFYCLC